MWRDDGILKAKELLEITTRDLDSTETWTGTWDKEEGRYVEEVGEEESRSIIEGILELEGTNLSYEELVERFNEFMKNPTDMVEMPSELLEDEKARDDWFDAISQFKEDNV